MAAPLEFKRRVRLPETLDEADGTTRRHLFRFFAEHTDERGVDALVAAMRWDGGELMPEAVEALRRIKYRPTGGFAQFCFADGHPSVTWSVLGHDRAPKLGYEALRAACAPVIVANVTDDQIRETHSTGFSTVNGRWIAVASLRGIEFWDVSDILAPRMVTDMVLPGVSYPGIGAGGIKVRVSGRLNGAEIARSEWYREGRVPLHTLRADVDYGTATAFTTFGTCGVKVWIFKGEILEHDPMAQDKRMAEGESSSSRPRRDAA